MSLTPPVRPGTAATLVALLVISPLASGCATGQGGRGGDETPSGPTTVEVDNGNFADVVVYALGDGRYQRLGTVTGHHRERFELPRHMEGALRLRLVADPIGATTSYFSEQLLFTPGDVLVLNVGATINLSSVSVRAGGSASGG